MAAVAIVGAGRVGLTLGRALRRSGHTVRMLTRTQRNLADGLSAETDWQDALAHAEYVLLAVPDDAIGQVAAQLAATGLINNQQTVLHCSGLRDRSVLKPLEPTGAALGSVHPLQSFPDTTGNPERLHGVPAIVEGDARAIAGARTLTSSLGFVVVLELSAGGKAKYHAAAVFASNYLVVLADIAQRLVGEAGISAENARELFAPIMRATVTNLASRSPRAVLTGPVARGDQGTVEAHLNVLEGRVREIYSLLAKEAEDIAGRTSIVTPPSRL